MFPAEIGNANITHGVDSVLDDLNDPPLTPRAVETPSEEADLIELAQDPLVLVAMLGDASTKDRIRIANKLPMVGRQTSLELLIGLLTDRAPAVQVAAINGLETLGNRACVNLLIDIMKRGPASVRIRTATALGTFADSTAYSILVEALDDPVWEVSKAAVLAVTKYQNKQIIPLLCKRLRDVYKDVRGAATEAINQLGGWNVLSGVDQLAAYLVAMKDWKYAKHLRHETLRLLKEDLVQTRETTRKDAMEGLNALNWTPRSVEERANLFFFNEEWDKVAALGQYVIPQLVNALRYSFTVLKEDPRQHAALLLNRLKWEPSNDEDRAYYHAALEEWDKVYSLDKNILVSPLCYILRRFAGPAYGFKTNPPLSAARGLEQLDPSDLSITTIRDVATLTADNELKVELCRILSGWGIPYNPNDVQ
jgi:hypothetical protein